ncbi:MAG: FAD-dependent oxidoreductase [Ilumatobacteraceae bacterium]
MTELYRVEQPHFIDRNFDSPLDLVRAWRPGLQLLRLGGFGRLGPKVASFFSDPRLQRIFSFQSMYAGLAPYEALALYAVITYMDSIEGVYVPEGGMHRMASGLAGALEQAGVRFEYETPVSRILRRADGSVRGVELGTGGELRADCVVANPDLPAVYHELLDSVPLRRRVEHAAYSPSCLLWVAGGHRPRPARRRPSQHPFRFDVGRVVSRG